MARQSFMVRDRERRLTERRLRSRARQLPSTGRVSRRRRVQALVRRIRRSIRNSDGLPTYESSVTNADGNVHTVTITPITTGDNNYSLIAAQTQTAALLRTLTRQEVTKSTGWTSRRAQDRITGYLQVTNALNPTSTQIYPIENLTEITQEKIDEIFFQMHQSETEVPFEQLEFSFVIAPTTYQAGAGTELSIKRGKGLGWETFSDEEGPINCAAVALILLTKKERFDQKLPLLKK